MQWHPESNHITEQRLSDQRRVIINNKRLSEELAEELRKEARCVTRLADGPRAGADGRHTVDQPTHPLFLSEPATSYELDCNNQRWMIEKINW